MADLNEQNSSQSVKLTGASLSGAESNYINADANGNIFANLRNASGNEAGTSSAPLRTDPTGTTTQPVSDAGGSLTVDGTVSAVQSGTWNINNISGTVSLPTGAATSANQTTTIAAIQETHGTVIPGTVATKSELMGGQFNTALPTLTNAQQSAIQLDSSGRQIIAPLTNTSIVKAQLQDNAGNAIASQNSNLKVVDNLDGAGTQAALTVGTTAVLVNVSGTNLANRKNVTLYNNSLVTIYWGYTNAVTTSTGTPIISTQMAVWDAGPNTNIYAIAGTASNNTRITESA